MSSTTSTTGEHGAGATVRVDVFHVAGEEFYRDVVERPSGARSACRYHHLSRAEARTCGRLRSQAQAAPAAGRSRVLLGRRREPAAATVREAVERLVESGSSAVTVEDIVAECRPGSLGRHPREVVAAVVAEQLVEDGAVRPLRAAQDGRFLVSR
ncbi:hypothetical protein [Vallicoccus soli]|nr:hypothetical protein [Vallicoccus soli]